MEAGEGTNKQQQKGARTNSKKDEKLKGEGAWLSVSHFGYSQPQPREGGHALGPQHRGVTCRLLFGFQSGAVRS
jgi:hypothetical protein